MELERLVSLLRARNSVDSKMLADWVDDHPEAEPVRLALARLSTLFRAYCTSEELLATIGLYLSVGTIWNDAENIPDAAQLGVWPNPDTDLWERVTDEEGWRWVVEHLQRESGRRRAVAWAGQMTRLLRQYAARG